jgi:hypothetical protein
VSREEWERPPSTGELEELGVETVVIPRKGKPGKARQAVEHPHGFRELVKWRTGCEGRVSHLKRRYGWDRSLVAGQPLSVPMRPGGFPDVPIVVLPPPLHQQQTDCP